MTLAPVVVVCLAPPHVPVGGLLLMCFVKLQCSLGAECSCESTVHQMHKASVLTSGRQVHAVLTKTVVVRHVVVPGCSLLIPITFTGYTSTAFLTEWHITLTGCFGACWNASVYTFNLYLKLLAPDGGFMR